MSFETNTTDRFGHLEDYTEFKKREEREAQARYVKYRPENIDQTKGEVRGYIDRVISVFRRANEEGEIADQPTIETHRLHADDLRTASAHMDTEMRIARSARYPDRPEQDMMTLDDRTSLTATESLYKHLRTTIASSLTHTVDRLDKLGLEDFESLYPPRDFDESDRDALREWLRATRKINRSERSKRFFHDVYVADFRNVIDEEHQFPGGALAIPTFENEQNGKRLADATVRAIQRIAELAKSEDVRAELSEISVGDIDIARKAHVRYESREEQNINVPVRMISEAAITTAQLAALMLADYKGDYDIADAMKSLEKNGVFKVMGLFPGGVIGPMSVNGGRWDPEVVLDKEKLQENEFALSDALRMKIIEIHTSRRSSTMGALARRTIENERSPFDRIRVMPDGLGCPARVKDMKFIVDLIIEELEKDEVVSAK